MKRAVMTAMVLGALITGSLGACKGDSAAQNPEEYVGSVVEDIKQQAAEELKKALAYEVRAFFRSDDLSKSLGIDSEGQAKLEESIRTYIDNYSADEEALENAKESLDNLLENAQGLSVEELQDRISGIFADESVKNR